MPALRSFSIDFWWDDYTEFLGYITAPAPIPATLSVKEQPRSLLHSLDIHWLQRPPEVVEIPYDELKNVTSLKISMVDFWYAASGCVLILPLFPLVAPDGENVVHLRLPRLGTLSISDVSDDLHFQVIRDVVHWRRKAGFPIKSLYVEGTSGVTCLKGMRCGWGGGS